MNAPMKINPQLSQPTQTLPAVSQSQASFEEGELRMESDDLIIENIS
jgi:hypothetical protein